MQNPSDCIVIIEGHEFADKAKTDDIPIYNVISVYIKAHLYNCNICKVNP